MIKGTADGSGPKTVNKETSAGQIWRLVAILKDPGFCRLRFQPGLIYEKPTINSSLN